VQTRQRLLQLEGGLLLALRLLLLDALFLQPLFQRQRIVELQGAQERELQPSRMEVEP
jgi:hypothetical protein